MNKIVFALALSVAGLASAVTAQTVPVTNLESGATPSTHDGTTFTAPTAELGQNRTPPQAYSSASIVAGGLDANGSLQLTGDRTRVYNDMTASGVALGTIQNLTMDFLVNNGGSNGGIQAPVLRVYVNDGGTISELIWEAVYNGGNHVGTEVTGAGTGNYWHQFIYGSGNTFVPFTSTYVYNSLAGWISGYGNGATLLGVGIGSGGDAGADFNALADNLTLSTSAGAVRYDFQAAGVPEPATWGMMLLGFLGIGAAMRRKGAKVAHFA